MQTLTSVPTGLTVVLWIQRLAQTLLDHTHALANQDTKEMARQAALFQVKCGTFIKAPPSPPSHHHHNHHHHHHRHYCYSFFFG